MTGVVAAGYALPAAPLAAGLAGLLLPPAARRAAGALGLAGTGAALALALYLAGAPQVRAGVTHHLDWADFGGVRVGLDLWVGADSAYVAVAVAAVAAAVQGYSLGYLRGDDRYAPYAAQVSVFTAAMLLVVVAGDLVLLLVGWEVMGLCSYLLIAHDRRLPEAPGAAVKAFLVTRVADVGFLLGVALLGIQAGTFALPAVAEAAYPAWVVPTAGLLILAGVLGKSAQFPLHTWLPDAMAGPTPVSALIHAATMVAAGGYVLSRLTFLLDGPAGTVLALVAAVTVLLGAAAAAAADDLKRVLAWSTVSQVGYIMGALAVGPAANALFHLLTHAAFKALLFLGAGAVIHAVAAGRFVGGLRRAMPVTFWCTALGLGALAGVPPLSGFFSKELILLAAAAGTGWADRVFAAAAFGGVALTGYYALRLLLRAFAGAPGPAAAGAHDPPWSMRAPLLLLAVPAALLGLGALHGDARRAIRLAAPHLDAAAALPLALTAAGAALAWWHWRRGPAGRPGAWSRAAAAGFGVDAAQRALVVRPTLALAGAARTADEVGVGGLVTGLGRAVRAAGDWVVARHRGPLPRALGIALGGLLVAAVAAGALGGAR
ncbi:hypothetical protein GCM10010124_01870 [Pilimelia terevasa]|uniref:NADH:quinone oxidoreductase/Mrp antiporter transmembrane domain-containing protein n=1 Tax=Pilimelia terevasa TaxID=53372 RepID=A0A8J3BD78_9ACTN|nr:proton-conducting transporter membrane subunit [Pilimelia terevasa]GGK12975.1 hypothetical protein GCM10010124_01870 [Pilimelia terevasa]